MANLASFFKRNQERYGDMKSTTRKPPLRRLSLALLGLPLCSLAQQATPTSTDAEKTQQLETITITVERRAQPLQKSSIAATVLTGDDLIKAGVDVVDQLQFVAPSTAANNFGQGVNITIRGIGKAETNTQTNTGVITYRDGVATFPGYLNQEPYFDIASIQILRGPQGTFGGQNATGGAVLLESNDPIINGGIQGYVSGQAGNYRDLGSQGAINLPISDTLAARFAYNTESRDSFWRITGPYTGSDARLRTHSGRIGLQWQPEKNFSVVLKTEYHHVDKGAYPADPFNSTRDPLDITANANLEALDRSGRTVLKVDYVLDSGIKLRSVIGYQRGTSIYGADLDGSATDPRNWMFYDMVDERISSQEFNIISPDAGPFTWLLGAYAQTDEHTFPKDHFIIGVPLGSRFSEYRLDGTNFITTNAVFGQMNYQVSDSLKVVSEGRYSRNTTRNDINVIQYGTPISDQQSEEFKNFSGKLALNYSPDPDNFFYGFLATAVKPGGLNVPVGLGLPAPFTEEKVQSIEFGWKAGWLDNRVNTQFNAFSNRYTGFQVSIGYPTNPTFRFELNTPNPTTIHGVEGSIQARLGSGWSARANLGWMQSSIGQFFATDPRAASTVSCNTATGPASATCLDLGGHEQTYSPRLTYNFSLERRFKAGDHIFTPRINYAHIGEQWGTLFQNRARGDLLEARNLVGAQIDWQHGDMMGSIYSTNLTDQRYLTAVGSGLRYVGAPRQYGVRFTKFF
jgi:iron complex outermembrane recepter protein